MMPTISHYPQAPAVHAAAYHISNQRALTLVRSDAAFFSPISQDHSSQDKLTYSSTLFIPGLVLTLTKLRCFYCLH